MEPLPQAAAAVLGVSHPPRARAHTSRSMALTPFGGAIMVGLVAVHRACRSSELSPYVVDV